jgi:hypothetical protein
MKRDAFDGTRQVFSRLKGGGCGEGIHQSSRV